jgi:DNA-binding LacI/PurR family transcriptional regulator
MRHISATEKANVNRPPTRRNGRVVTLEDVARAAGVSRATVSRVVNRSVKVSPDAQRAVERAIEQLGYVPNLAARSLVTRRSDSIGLVVPEPTGFLYADPYFPALLRGITAECSAAGLQLVLLMPQSRADEERAEAFLAAGHLDGALLVSLHGNDPLPKRLREHGIPVVVGGRPPAGANVSYVDVDNENGARMAVEHLFAVGRRVVATIGGPLDMPAGIDRLAGYRHARLEAGFPVDHSLEVHGPFTREAGAMGMRSLLERRPDIDAVFAASDLLAAGALQEILASGRRVPDDIALVGFDDSPLAETIQPPLTSVRQPIEEMGREMTRILIGEIASSTPVTRRVILGTQLVVRASSTVSVPLAPPEQPTTTD